mmetsp:Transcript_277/g.857  ORF Transcript_277/g.857 Transcript_277/m.857 type:complete len:86 (-) Transcript_277:315-572(-)
MVSCFMDVEMYNTCCIAMALRTACSANWDYSRFDTLLDSFNSGNPRRYSLQFTTIPCSASHHSFHCYCCSCSCYRWLVDSNRSTR